MWSSVLRRLEVKVLQYLNYEVSIAFSADDTNWLTLFPKLLWLCDRSHALDISQMHDSALMNASFAISVDLLVSSYLWKTIFGHVLHSQAKLVNIFHFSVTANYCEGFGNIYRPAPGSGCSQYTQSTENFPTSTFSCPPGLLFSVRRCFCDYPENVICIFTLNDSEWYCNVMLKLVPLPLSLAIFTGIAHSIHLESFSQSHKRHHSIAVVFLLVNK